MSSDANFKAINLLNCSFLDDHTSPLSICAVQGALGSDRGAGRESNMLIKLTSQAATMPKIRGATQASDKGLVHAQAKAVQEAAILSSGMGHLIATFLYSKFLKNTTNVINTM